MAHHVCNVAVVLPHLCEQTGVLHLVRQRPLSNRPVRGAAHDATRAGTQTEKSGKNKTPFPAGTWNRV